jgi:hypothetical protein
MPNKKSEIKLETNKSAKEGSQLFYNIIAAAVSGNPKPTPKKAAKKK